MARHGIAIAVACIYVACASWVVRSAGRSYRDSGQRAAVAARPVPAPPIPSHPGGAPDRIDVAKAEPTDPPPASPPHRPDSGSGSDPATSEPEKRITASAPTPPPTASSRPTPPPPAAGELADRISQWKHDPFWSRPDLALSWDLDRLTLQDEQRLGEQLNGLILGLNSEDAGPALERVNAAARPLLKSLNPNRREYRFSVLNTDVANAFSHPGGYIYVSRKLLEILPEDEEYLLEFVIAHEMAHVERGHALACLRDPGVRQLTDGTLQKLYLLIIPNGYPDPLEYEADAWAYRRMRGLQRSEYECLKFLRILATYAREHRFGSRRGKLEEFVKERLADPKGDRTLSPIDNHLRSHPAVSERINRLKELGAAAGR